MKTTRIFGSILTGALLLTSALAGSHAQARDNPKMTIMVGGLDKIIYLVPSLTQQLGYFDQEGLTVDLLDEPPGFEPEKAMLSGQLDAVVGFYDHNISLQATNQNTESIIQLDAVPGEVEMVATKMADQIKSPADFKDKHLGVTNIGSSTDFLTRYLALKNGLTLDQITIVPAGAGDTFITAIEQGVIDAGMTTEPTVSRLVKSGEGKVLIDMRTRDGTIAALGGPYPGACVYTRIDWVNAHKDIVQKMANAMVKTLHYIHTHSAAEIAAQVPESYYAGDKDLYLQALSGSLDMFTTDGLMPKDGPDTALKVQSAFNPNVKGKTIDLSKTFTDEFTAAANQASAANATLSATASATMAATP